MGNYSQTKEQDKTKKVKDGRKRDYHELESNDWIVNNK